MMKESLESNLMKSGNHSVSNTRIYNNDALKTALVIAFDRLNLEPFPIDNMIRDIRACYPDVRTEIITQAIREGVMGVYGKTYRFSFQEVSIWIRENLKASKSENSRYFKS